MKEPISIKEILAIVIKQGKAVILCALALAVLLGGLQGGKELAAARDPENTDEMVTARNEKTLADYNEQRAIVQSYIDNAAYKLEEVETYLEESLYMQLDPNNEYRCHVLMSVLSQEEVDGQDLAKRGDVPVEYSTVRIQEQYISYWNNMDMSQTMKDNPYADVAEKYIREVVTLQTVDPGQLFLVANAPDAETAYALCQSAYQALVDAYDTVAASSYAHELVVVDTATKLGVDTVIAKDQYFTRQDAAEYMEEVYKYEQQLLKISKPSVEEFHSVSGAVKKGIKWAIIGGVVGVFLACAMIWLVYIVKDGVESSRQAEAILGVPFFGSVEGKKDIFVRFANWFVGERQWSDRNEAVSYITENVRSRVAAPSSIALVSTRNVKETDEGIRLAMQALQELGYTVRFAGKAEQNPAAIAALRDCEYVVMAERLGAASRNAMLYTVEQAKQLKAELLGFITV